MANAADMTVTVVGLEGVAARLDRQERAIREIVGFLALMPEGGKVDASARAAILAALDGDAGEDGTPVRGTAEWLDAPAPPPGEMPQGALWRAAEYMMGEANRLDRTREGAEAAALFRRDAAALESWAAAQPPALDAEARETIREAAAMLTDAASEYQGPRGFMETGKRWMDCAARLLALAGEP